MSYTAIDNAKLAGMTGFSEAMLKNLYTLYQGYVQGNNIYYNLELSPWEAVLGASIHISTLDGTVALKVPPGTTAEQEFRLRGKGLPTDKGTRGDLHAIVRVQVPSLLTPEEQILWEQLASISTFNPRRTI